MNNTRNVKSHGDVLSGFMSHIYEFRFPINTYRADKCLYINTHLANVPDIWPRCITTEPYVAFSNGPYATVNRRTTVTLHQRVTLKLWSHFGYQPRGAGLPPPFFPEIRTVTTGFSPAGFQDFSDILQSPQGNNTQLSFFWHHTNFLVLP